MIRSSDSHSEMGRIAIIGLGYVGLPLAVALDEYYDIIGYDINTDRVNDLKAGIDRNGEIDQKLIIESNITFTNDEKDLNQCDIYIVAVPTGIDQSDYPDLSNLKDACSLVGKHLDKGNLIIFESTVYPGCTEEECIPILEHASDLKYNIDFDIAYSPERINPGQALYSLRESVKIVGASNNQIAKQCAGIYEIILKHPCHLVSSIKAAEASKILENTQRDINISLMNEMAIIFDKMGIDTGEVIEAAATKWNFHKYYPGLVGGHCISVDPHYLIYKAKQLGHIPQVIAAGRRVNDYIPKYLAAKVVQQLISEGINPGQSRVLILGLTFKEDVRDVRNSKTLNLIEELIRFSVKIDTFDPGMKENISSTNHYQSKDLISDKYDAIIISVAHSEFKSLDKEWFKIRSKGSIIIFDVKGIHHYLSQNDDVKYWSL